jgi:hypothetical protein
LKEVNDIKLNNDGSINYVTFTDGDRYPRITPARYQGRPIEYAVYFDQPGNADHALTALTLKVPEGWDIDTTDVDRGVLENDDPFAPSSRVANQIQQDRHPLKDYLSFDDYDMLMDEFADTQSAVKNDSELDAYLEKFESGVKSAGIPQVVVDIVEEFVHGRHGKYGTEVPRRNQALLADLNKAFGQIWIHFKPDRFAQTLARHMSLACVAAINAEDQDEFYESDDDMFATARHTPRTRIISFLEDADSYQQDGDNYSAIECLEQADVYQQQLGHDKNPRMEDIHIMITRIIESIDGGNTDSYEIHTNIDDVIEYFEYDMIDESDDDLFAMTKAQKISQGLRGYAAELKSDIDSAHPTWGDTEQHQRETAKLEFVLFLAGNFNNASKVPYTLNYIARVLNGDSRVVEYFKRHAIWDADDYLKEKIGYGFAELFSEYEGQIDEDDDMFADSSRIKLLKTIVDDLAYLADEMINDADGFIDDRGWSEDESIETNDVVEAGHAFAHLGETFKTGGMDKGLTQLMHLWHHNNNQVVEWIADETIEHYVADYNIDMSRFNVNEGDDMFSAPGKVAKAAKHNVSRKLAVVNKANRATDQELQKIVEIAKAVYGRPYSTGTIGGGKVYRLSIPARVNHDYRYVKLDSVSVDDKTILNQAKGKFFDLLKQHGLAASRVDIKYHIGSGLYVSVRIKMKDVA